MKYVSIDIETTGLDAEKHQVLSIGAVIEDTQNQQPIENLPKFHVAIIRETIVGSLYAINMNMDLIENINLYVGLDSEEKHELEIITGMKFLKEEDVVVHFYNWLAENGIVEDKTPFTVKSQPIPCHLNVAGKNFGTFDKLFLEKLPRWKQLIRVRQRILDPSILFVKWIKDESLPSLSTCKDRANIPGIVTHDALEDAIDVVNLLRTCYYRG